MEACPATPLLSAAPPSVTASGHLWLLELVDGGPLRFAVAPSGLVTFGDAEREYADPAELPPPYRAAVRAIRERLDRDALRDAVDGVDAVTFCGRATFRRSVEYEWDRLPAFLGYDVWSGSHWLPPDAAERVYDVLGLTPAPVVERELRARDFTPTTDVPRSAYYDGPAAGVLVRNKAGGRARVPNEDVVGNESTAEPVPSIDALVKRFVAPVRRRSSDDGLPAAGRTETIDRVMEAIYREVPHAIDGDRGFDESAVRGAVARALGPTHRDG